MSEDRKVLYPITNFEFQCPRCRNRTRYRKTYYSGPEGQWCDNCKAFISDMIHGTFPLMVEIEEDKIDKINTLQRQIQEAVDKRYKEICGRG